MTTLTKPAPNYKILLTFKDDTCLGCSASLYVSLVYQQFSLGKLFIYHIIDTRVKRKCLIWGRFPTALAFQLKLALTLENFHLYVHTIERTILSSNGNDMETKAERSFDLVFVFNIEAKQTCLFYTLERLKRSKFCLYHKFEISKRSKLCLFHKLERAKRSEVYLFRKFKKSKRSELCLFHKLERSKRSEVCLFRKFKSLKRSK